MKLFSCIKDLWALPETRLAHSMADSLGEQFYSRCPEHVKPASCKKSLEKNRKDSETMKKNEPNDPIDRENSADRKGGEDGSRQSLPPIASTTSAFSAPTPSTKYLSSRWLRNTFKRVPKHDPTEKLDDTPAQPNYGRIFFGALHATLLWRWWLAGLFKLVGGKFILSHSSISELTPLLIDTLQTTTPLISKALLTWLVESYFFHRFGPIPGQPTPRGIGYGVGLAVALFGMQGGTLISSITEAKYFFLMLMQRFQV